MSTPTTVIVPTRWTGLLKKCGLAALFLVVLVYLLPGQPARDQWRSHPSQKPAEEIEKEEGLHMPTEADIAGVAPLAPSGFDLKMKEFGSPLNTSDWGLMAKQVMQLSEWATIVSEASNIGTDPRNMNNAFLARFPYLKESKMYRPWGYQREEDRETLAKTGLIMCVGSRNFHLASHLIASLRQVLKSKVPIEVAFAGDNDLKPDHRTFLKTLDEDITFIDLLKFFPQAKVELEGSGWAMKPYSMLASKHTRVMLVDADALFLTNPEDLFETHSDLKRTGTLLFHDRAALGGGDEGLVFLKEQIAAAGREPSKQLSEHSLFYTKDSWYEADSGLVAVDKSRPDVFMSLVFVTWLNTKSVRDEVSYKKFYGDKETFWIAMELTGIDYFFQKWYAGSMGHIMDDHAMQSANETVELCSTHMLHMNEDGTVPFWFNGGIYQHKDVPDQGFADITHYWRGGADKASAPDWYWMDNVACLKEKNVLPVPPEMREALSRMYEKAAKIDEEIKKLPASKT